MSEISLLTVGADLALLISAALSALWAFNARERASDRGAVLRVWALGASFVGLAVVLQLLPEQADLGVLRRMSLNLAVFAALPLMSLALLARARGWDWAPAAWGRGLLGLFALFELTRQMGHGASYTWLLGTGCLAALGLASLQLSVVRARALALTGTSALAGALLLGASNPLLSLADPVALRGFGALALLLFSSALHSDLAGRASA